MATTRYWQDLTTGEHYSAGPTTVSKHDVVEFARDFDPQPYHMDAEAAEASIFGGLCASGWQICALAMRLLSEAVEGSGAVILGARGVPALRWKRPLYAGDSVAAQIELSELSAGPTAAAYGVALFTVTLANQDQQPVLTMHCELMIDSRQTEEQPHG